MDLEKQKGVRSEQELFQALFDGFRAGLFGAKYCSASNQQLPYPKGNPSTVIPDNQYDRVVEFFLQEVLPFAIDLNSSGEALSNSLMFDLHEIYGKICSTSGRLSARGAELADKLPKSTAKMVKEAFRFFLWPWLKESYFVSRGLLKPRGYPGDHIIVEKMYDGNARSMGLGYVYDTIFLKTQLCQGLRNRKDQMKQIISNYLLLSEKKRLKMLNVGCGGSRELREIELPLIVAGLDLCLIDFDQAALDFSAENLRPLGPRARIRPLKMDVRKLINRDVLAGLGISQCDLIYSIGLFDYLPDTILSKLIGALFSSLGDNGILIFAHKDHAVYDPKISDWFCDWKYYPRTQEDIEKIFAELNMDRNMISFSREIDGYIFFVEIRSHPLKI